MKDLQQAPKGACFHLENYLRGGIHEPVRTIF
jgi:hypothetical protein